MSTLTVWKFNTADGADAAAAQLADMSKQELIDIIDAAVVRWEEGKKRPKTEQEHNLAAAGALGGAFWGLLFGLLFFMPLLGMAVGAASGALGGAFSDVGIDDDFIDKVRAEVTPGTSALFLMSDNVVIDRVKSALAGATLIESNLSDDQLDKLRAAFAED